MSSVTYSRPIGRFVGRGVRAAYGASKAGVVLLTKSVASQYGSRGIRCNAVVPGLVLTPAVDQMTSEQIEASLEGYPMPRLCEPKDVANAVLFLASDEAGFVNGDNADGGGWRD